jgi:hypothetical protein
MDGLDTSMHPRLFREQEAENLLPGSLRGVAIGGIGQSWGLS